MSHQGEWYFPNGSVLRFGRFGDNIFQNRQSRRVDLRCRYPDVILNGIYECAIETNAANNDNGREIFYIGLYASGGMY